MSVSKEDLFKTSEKNSKPMTRLLEKDTPFEFDQDCLVAFQTLKGKLVQASIVKAPEWDRHFELM